MLDCRNLAARAPPEGVGSGQWAAPVSVSYESLAWPPRLAAVQVQGRNRSSNDGRIIANGLQACRGAFYENACVLPLPLHFNAQRFGVAWRGVAGRWAHVLRRTELRLTSAESACLVR